jgi:hypothetical protein
MKETFDLLPILGFCFHFTYPNENIPPLIRVVLRLRRKTVRTGTNGRSKRRRFSARVRTGENLCSGTAPAAVRHSPGVCPDLLAVLLRNRRRFSSMSGGKDVPSVPCALLREQGENALNLNPQSFLRFPRRLAPAVSPTSAHPPPQSFMAGFPLRFRVTYQRAVSRAGPLPIRCLGQLSHFGGQSYASSGLVVERERPVSLGRPAFAVPPSQPSTQTAASPPPLRASAVAQEPNRKVTEQPS